MIYLVIGLAIFLLWKLLKPYVISCDTVLLFTGGLGSGKSLLSSEKALQLLRKNRVKVWWYNLMPWHKVKKPKPLLYSSIPFRVSLNEWAVRLTPAHLLLQRRLIEKSVCYLDELDSFANQFDFKLQPILENFNEYMRLFRHYTKGGYLVTNTQASDNCVLQIRRRINTCLNLLYFKKYFGIFYTVKIRNISLSEELKTVQTGNVEDEMCTKFGILPLFIRHYDTYCYSERYETVPFETEEMYTRLKTNVLLTCPRKAPETKTKKTDDEREVA